MRSWVLLFALGHRGVCHGRGHGLRRTSPITMNAKVQLFEAGPDGSRTPIDHGSEERLKEALCSERVVSRLKKCRDGDVGHSLVLGLEDNLYPMSDAYHHAVQAGHACPLPAPFMVVGASGECCVPPNGDKRVWPNFCPTINLIGTAKSGDLKWEVVNEANFHPPPSIPRPKASLPEGTYVLGRPDLPNIFEKYHMDYKLLGMYIIIILGCLAFSVYVIQRLEDERTIVKGKEREGNFFAAGKSGLNLFELSDEEEDPLMDGEDDNVSNASSLSPAHHTIARDEQVAASVGQVSMSFGLLPGLPRGRSTNVSALNSPRLTARERQQQQQTSQ